MPLIGPGLKRLLLGGEQIGTLTLSRFFVLHVFVIPAFLFAFIALHVYLFRRSRPAGPFTADPVEPRLPAESFYPRQLLMDVVFAVVIVIALAAFAHFSPATIGPQVNPSNTRYVPRPEWYYLPLFQWLKYWPGREEVIGMVVVPSIVLLLFVLVPFLDRGRERRQWRRPVPSAIFLGIFGTLILLGVLSHRDDARNPAIARQLARQQEEVVEYMKQPFEPKQEGTVPVAFNPAVAPAVAEGEKVFAAQQCNACHGDGGVGTAAGPRLIGIGSRFTADQLAGIIRKPTPKMAAGGMPPFAGSDDELKAVIAYLQSLK